MNEQRLGLWARIWLALTLPWRALFDGVLAQQITQQLGGRAALTAAKDPTAALQLLAILQREGRLLDFLHDDVAPYSDAEIGAAARAVHAGCKRGLRDYLVLEPVRPEAEGTAVVLEPGFDPSRTRVTGRVAGEPPYKGVLAHPGWRAAKLELPALAADHDPTVLAPAEVEIA
jgi:hypothetical protein